MTCRVAFVRLCSVDMSGVENQEVQPTSSSSFAQLLSFCNKENNCNEVDNDLSNEDDSEEYSHVKLLEKAEAVPLIPHAPSSLPAVSCHIGRPENVLSSAVTNSATGEDSQPAPLSSVVYNEMEQNSALLVHERDGDAAAEEDISEDDDDDDADDDKRENDEAGECDYLTASEVSNTADMDSYMVADVVDETTETLPDQYMLAVVSEPASDSMSTSGSYWLAQALPDAAAGSSGSVGTSADHGPDGSSDEPTTVTDGLQSPESDDGYCAAEFFTNSNTD